MVSARVPKLQARVPAPPKEPGPERQGHKSMALDHGVPPMRKEIDSLSLDELGGAHPSE